LGFDWRRLLRVDRHRGFGIVLRLDDADGGDGCRPGPVVPGNRIAGMRVSHVVAHVAAHDLFVASRGRMAAAAAMAAEAAVDLVVGGAAGALLLGDYAPPGG